MNFLRRSALTMLLLGGLVCGCAPAVTARAQTTRPSPPIAAGPPEAAPPDTSSAAAKQAFVDGYRAWQSHDNVAAIPKLQYAAANYPILSDYALYYLGLCQRDSGDLAGAATSFERLRNLYPDSVMAPAGDLELARAYLKLGRAQEAAAVASHLATQSSGGSIEQNARLVEALGLAALGRTSDAYAQAMELRNLYPRSRADAGARTLAHSLLSTNPNLAPSGTLEYRQSEAELLLREDQPQLALAQAKRAMALNPPAPIRAELLWIEAQAYRGDETREKRALLAYMALAPRGPSAPSALNALALLYWREDDRDSARETFARIAAQFPGSSHAPGALLRIGRIYEELHQYDSARVEYTRLYDKYPESESAEDARFRAPWTYFMTGQYRVAAGVFAAMRPRAHSISERDQFDYWRARSLENIGEPAAARVIYLRLAASTDSNYYPELASRRVATTMPDLPAASVPDPAFAGVPASSSALVRFHLSRALALRSLGLSELEVLELRALESASAAEPDLRNFILAGFLSAGAWHDAIVAAVRMEKRGELGSAEAERLRYPRAYWELISGAAKKRSLDPYLVLALARQESLFNPSVTSVSDAQGLMQLLPSTARRVALENAIDPMELNLFDPEVNVALGTAYLQGLFTMFDGDAFKAVAAYNGGEHAVETWTREFPGEDDEWVENIGYQETRDYVKKVIGGRREYRLLYGSSIAPFASSRDATPIAAKR